MTYRLQTVAAVVALCAAGCPADDDGQQTGTQGTSGSRSSETGSSGSSGAEPLSFEEFSEVCRAQAHQTACEVVDLFEGDGASEPQFGYCLWETSVPVELLKGGDCVFGEPTGRCVVGTASSEGCAVGRADCGGIGGDRFGGMRETGNTRTLVEGSFCYGVPNADSCVIGEGGVVLEDGPPECACFCAPDFPG